MREERWNYPHEIKRRLHDSTDPNHGAGPILYVENGRKYSDGSEAHIALIGQTGMGKSQCGSLPFLRDILLNNESAVAVDPKGELFQKMWCFIPEHYQKFCIDFRNPRHSFTSWNPLTVPYTLWKSQNLDDNDVAASMISEFWDAVFPETMNKEFFWTAASRNFMRGLTYSIYETASGEYVNLDSISSMMHSAEKRYAVSTVLRTFYETLPSDSLAKRCLSTYCNAARDTAASIFSTSASQFEMFSRSKGLMELLRTDTLNLLDLDVNQPFIIFIVIPDETNTYDTLAGTLVSQIVQHLIRVAQGLEKQRLPIRCNVILEELGSVGRSIPSLPNLMVAGRSRNIRIMLVLQSYAQLFDVYQKSKAETIISCIGITIGFSTNSWDTLTEWSQRCGERHIEINSHLAKEPLITPAQIAAMPVGTALILINNRYKFVSRIPLFDELYDNSAWKVPEHKPIRVHATSKVLDFEAHLAQIKQQQMHALSNTGPRMPSTSVQSQRVTTENIEDVLADIQKNYAALKKQEKETKVNMARIIITSDNGNTSRIAAAISTVTGFRVDNIEKALEKKPFELLLPSKKLAKSILKEVIAVGGTGTIKDCSD